MAKQDKGVVEVHQRVSVVQEAEVPAVLEVSLAVAEVLLAVAPEVLEVSLEAVVVVAVALPEAPVDSVACCLEAVVAESHNVAVVLGFLVKILRLEEEAKLSPKTVNNRTRHPNNNTMQVTLLKRQHQNMVGMYKINK